MVRPEPDQPLDKADIGSGGGVEARLGLVQKSCCGSGGCWFGGFGRRRNRAAGICMTRPRASPASASFCARCASFCWALLLGVKVENRARGFARSTANRLSASPAAGPIEIGEQRAARIGGNGGDLIADRPETEPMQSERRRFSTCNRFTAVRS